MNVAIIGGGASGMMLGAMLNQNSNINTTIFEKNSKLGKKLLITGNGKCNFTSGDFSDINNIYNSNFACELYKLYNEKSFLDFFKSIGIDYRLEYHKGNKFYYPRNNKSTSVYYNLLDKIVSNGVKIIYNAFVTEIKKNSGEFFVKLSDEHTYKFDKVVISTGGKSYANTGSDGSGYELAKQFSHTIIKPLPGLTSLYSKDEFFKYLKGVRVDAKVTVIGHDDITETGEVQFTEHYISGIPILNISSKVIRMIDSGEKISLNIDFLIDHNYLKKRIHDISYKKQSDFLCGILPDELGKIIMKKSGANMSSSVLNIDDKLLKKICEIISNFTISISSYSGFDTAQVTIGGVDTKEVSNLNLESKLVKGLYFTGEILDIDGKCGGYNLQLAYSSAKCVYGGICGI